MLSPVATLGADGCSATVRWHEVVMTGRFDMHAEWAGGIHIVDYVWLDGEWYISKMHYHPQFSGPYAQGWHHVAEHVPLTPFHYDADSAGDLIRMQKSSENLSAGDAALSMALEAVGKVQNLTAAYGFYLDRKLYADIVDLFEEDGELILNDTYEYCGRDGIQSGLEHLFDAPDTIISTAH